MQPFARLTVDTPAAPVQVAPLLPVAAIVGAPVLSVNAGSSAVLNSSASACYNGPCITTFVVDCGSKQITRSGADTATTLTTGFGAGVDLDMANLSSLKCGVAVTVTDVNGANSSATATLQVTAAQLGPLTCLRRLQVQSKAHVHSMRP